MDIYNDILSYIQFSIEFKRVKASVIKPNDYLIGIIRYLFCIKDKNHINVDCLFSSYQCVRIKQANIVIFIKHYIGIFRKG